LVGPVGAEGVHAPVATVAVVVGIGGEEADSVVIVGERVLEMVELE